jgi:hypothetical protein
MARVFDLRKFMSSRARGLPDPELPKERHPRRKRKSSFVLVPLAAAAQAAKATRSAKLFVWLLLLHRVWRDKNQAVALSNRALAPYGIGRDTKCRALADLEAAGLIRVRRHGTKTVLVTVFLERED